MKHNEEDGWRSFLELCLKVQSLNDLDGLFSLLLTAAERSEISVRCLIIKELIRGEKTQREMARDLKTSIANVSRGSNSLKITKPDLRRFFLE